MKSAILGAILFAASVAASATVIQSATVVSSTAPAAAGYTAAKLIDQSGLSLSYVSGVTDFDAYAAANPTHYGTSEGNGYFAAAPASVVFDLGARYTLTKFGLWNDNDFQGVKNFTLEISPNTQFNNPASLGSFVATYGPDNYSIPVGLQIFDLADAAGRYVRLTFTNANAGSYVNVGEVIFGAGPTVAAAVPEPGIVGLLGLGLLGLAASRRKTAKK